jgi:hypothetical protein
MWNAVLLAGTQFLDIEHKDIWLPISTQLKEAILKKQYDKYL